jgi:hypothetical protein
MCVEVPHSHRTWPNAKCQDMVSPLKRMSSPTIATLLKYDWVLSKETTVLTTMTLGLKVLANFLVYSKMLRI